MFRDLLTPVDNFYSFFLKNRFVELFPTGGGWTIVALGSFYITVAVALLLIFVLLRFIHSGRFVEQVSVSYWKNGVAMGAAFAITALIDPKGGWNVFAIVAFGCWGLVFLVLLHCKISALGNPPHGKWLYWIVGLEFFVFMFLIGVSGMMTLVGTILLLAALAVGWAMLCGGVKSMSEPTPAGGGSARRRATLEDGTELEEDAGGRWNSLNDFGATYHENFDGTFTKD